jgi:hypothetical protein
MGSSYRPSPGHERRQSMAGLAATLGVDSEALDSVRKYTTQVEDVIERVTQPLKPYLPAAARYVCVFGV